MHVSYINVYSAKQLYTKWTKFTRLSFMNKGYHSFIDILWHFSYVFQHVIERQSRKDTPPKKDLSNKFTLHQLHQSNIIHIIFINASQRVSLHCPLNDRLNFRSSTHSLHGSAFQWWDRGTTGFTCRSQTRWGKCHATRFNGNTKQHK